MKLAAGLSLDLDNEWSYLKTHGDQSWTSYPSYFDVLIPYTLELLDELGLRITFFIVGQDAALEKNRAALAMITDRGHEVGNHSFSHEPWLHLYDAERVRTEINDTADLIEQVTGQRPRGFRGPGFSVSPTVLTTLADGGYLYDASTLPTYLGPLARAYYFRTARLTAEEKKERAQLFGTFATGLQPTKPYLWRLDAERRLLELPVTTIPAVKTPFHLSYLLYLSRYSELAMHAYLEGAIAMCRVTATPIAFLLHPLDLLGREQASDELAFFPGMDLESKKKKTLFKKVLTRLARTFDVMPMSELADRATRSGKLLERPAAS